MQCLMKTSWKSRMKSYRLFKSILWASDNFNKIFKNQTFLLRDFPLFFFFDLGLFSSISSLSPSPEISIISGFILDFLRLFFVDALKVSAYWEFSSWISDPSSIIDLFVLLFLFSIILEVQYVPQFFIFFFLLELCFF